jgi:hypothetical protein
MLSPGEIVLPRSVALDEDAPEEAARFVEKIQEREDRKRGGKGFGRVLAIEQRLARGGKVEEKPRFEPRVRFNWGYHDGALAAKEGIRPQWKSPHFDPHYEAGYNEGTNDHKLGEYHEDSSEAWSRTRPKKAQTTERELRYKKFARGGKADVSKLSLGKRTRSRIYQDEEN